VSTDEELTDSERSALVRERDRAEPGPEAAERMLRRLRVAVAIGGAPFERQGGADGTGGAKGEEAPPNPASAGSFGRALTTRTAVAAALGALVGSSAVAIATHSSEQRAREQRAPETQIAYVERDAQPNEPTLPVPPPMLTPSASPLPAAVPTSPRGRTPAASAPAPDTLTTETNLLDAARTALGRGA
jgi:hypothetical protein